MGIPFDSLTLPEAAVQIARMIASGRPHYVVTANVDFLVQSREDTELREIILDADLVLCDGTPLVWMSRWLGNPLPERAAGADLVPVLIEQAARLGHRVFLLGATEESAAQAAERIRARHPTITLDHYSPPFAPLEAMDHAEIARRIREARPDLLLVSFGCPKQEKWISRHYRALGVPVAIGVGATIDFLAGKVRRAPRWMQRTGTEWLFRLAQEPRRLLSRYGKDLRTFGLAALTELRHFAPRPPEPIEPRCRFETAPDSVRVRLPECVDIRFLQAAPDLLPQILATGRSCLLDLTHVQHLDSSGIAWLIQLDKATRIRGQHLLLVGPSEPVQRLLRHSQLEEYFACLPDLRSAEELLALAAQERAAIAPARRQSLDRRSVQPVAANSAPLNPA